MPEPTPDTTPGPEPGSVSFPDAKSLVATCLSLLAAKAWEAMGLVPNPETKQI